MARLGAVCARLPKAFSVFWGLECPLGTERAEADVLVEIRRDTSRHALLAGDTPSAIDPLCEAVPAWAALRRFAQRWRARDDERRELVRNVWIEFDLIAAAQASPPLDALTRPSVFWGPHEIGPNDWQRFVDFTDYVRESFTPFPDRLPLAGLERAVRSLPDGARVFQVGAMQLRGDVRLRLCVNSLPLSAMAGWLAAQQWSGDADSLLEALTALAPHVRKAALDVDYTAGGIGPKIGLECYQEWQQLNTDQWQPLLNHTHALGLCAPSRRDAVTLFPAKTEYSLRHQYDHPEDGHFFPVVYRNIHHVKLSFVGAGFRDAKAYLGVTRPGVRVGFPLREVPDGDADEWLSR